MSYVRIWVHMVYGTKNREPFLFEPIKTKLINHIKENAKEKAIFIDEINGGNDHIHCLISLYPDQSIAKVTQLIKGESSFWLNKNNITKTKFEWADKYYAVSASESQVGGVRKYIRNQEEHHRRKSFIEECGEFMKKYGFECLG